MGISGRDFGLIGSWIIGRGRPIIIVGMSMRRVIAGVLGVLLGLAWPARAADGTRPDQYQTLDRKTVQDQVSRLNKGRLTPKELARLSSGVHGVNILTLSPSDTNNLAATSRPTGSLQLNRIVNSVGSTSAQ